MLVHQRFRRLEIFAFADGDQPVTARHDIADGLIEIGFETQVTIGDDADDVASLDDGQPGDASLLRQRDHFADRHVGRNRDRILDDARFEALDLRDFRRLLFGREILVDDTQAAFLRHGDGEVRFGHGIHRRGEERDVEGESAGEAGGEADFAGNDARVSRNQQYIVEG